MKQGGIMKRLCIIAISALALTGCTNLDAVRSISSDLTSASSSWKVAGNELYESCKRRYAINDKIQSCEMSKASSEGLAAATEVLRVYFATLGAAAVETNFSVEPGIDDVSQAVRGVELIEDSQVEAVTGLAKVLSKLVLGAKRERVIRDLIDGEGDRVLGIINGLLKDHVAELLQDQLATERSALLVFYDKQLQQAGLEAGRDLRKICADRLPSDRPALEFLIVQEFCERDALVQKRQDALDAYEKSLDKAADAMRDLQSNKTRLTGKEFARNLYKIGDELKASVEDVRTAFN